MNNFKNGDEVEFEKYIIVKAKVVSNKLGRHGLIKIQYHNDQNKLVEDWILSDELTLVKRSEK